MKLDIILPRNRIYAGFFTLTTRHKHLLLAGRARGKADNRRAVREGNPSRSSLLPYGDAPLGEYADSRVIKTHNARLGHSWIPIVGTSGDALKAVENGRTGLGIHAGRSDTDGNLVATYGCVRLDVIDFERLAGILDDDPVSIRISERWGGGF